jgi:hypothetical protein
VTEPLALTYMSIVGYVDAERVALSRQFFNKTRANLDANPYGQVRVVDPDTMAEYALDLCCTHTEPRGRRSTPWPRTSRRWPRKAGWQGSSACGASTSTASCGARRSAMPGRRYGSPSATSSVGWTS